MAKDKKRKEQGQRLEDPASEAQPAAIRVRVLRQGQADAEKRVRPPCEVRETLERLGISPDQKVEMRDSAGFSMGRLEMMRAGDYTLVIAGPHGASPHPQKDQPLSAFWAALADAKQEKIGSATFLKLGGGMKFPLEGCVADRLFVRDCYVHFAKQATEYCEQLLDVNYSNGIKKEPIEAPVFILRGNPGIGKSLFHYYFMKDLAASGKTVVWQRKDRPTVLFTKDGASKGEQPESLAGFMQYLDKAETWYLCDGLAPIRVAAKTLFVTSPDHEKIKEAVKWPFHKTKWMPVWNLETELIPAGIELFKLSQNDVKAKVSKWGPTPRHALQKSDAENEVELAAAIGWCSLTALQSCFADPDTAPKGLSHRLICISVGADYERGRIHFASDHVEQRVISKFEALGDGTVKHFLASSSGDAAINGFRGKLLESIRGSAHDILQRGGCFNGYNLQTGEQEEIVLPACQIKQTLANHTALSTLPPGVYGKGKENLGGIDAAVKPGWLFQITVSGNHNINTKTLVNTVWEMGGPQGLKLVWALHPFAFTPHFKRQTFRKLKDISEEGTEAARRIPQYMLELRDFLPTSMGTVSEEGNQPLVMEE